MQDQQTDDHWPVVFKSQWRELLGGNYILKRILLATTFWLILTAFLHFRQVRMEVLEIGTRATRYVISQTGFSFLDTEATWILSQEALRDIGAIFKIDETQIDQFRKNFEQSLVGTQTWREELPNTTFEEVYSLLDTVSASLSQERFTDQRTLNKMRLLNIDIAHFFVIDSRALKTEPMVLPQVFWQGLDVDGQTDLNKYVIRAFASQSWKLQEDFSLERSIRQEVEKEVPSRFTHVDPGIQIIKPGEKVTSRHIAMLQSMQNALTKARTLFAPLSLLASALIALSLLIAGLIYLHCFHRELLKSLQKTTLLVTLMLLGLALAKCAEHLLLHSNTQVMEAARIPLLIPFVALLFSVLINYQIALAASFFLLTIFAATLAVDFIPFLVLNFFVTLTTLLFARRLHKRKKVFVVCGKIYLSIIPMLFAFNYMDSSATLWNFVIDLTSGFVFLAVTAVLVIALLPILEFLFHVMTDMVLMEYMDPDHELLRRLSLEAPGTYQHCLIVGNISEAAARAIGANGLFCRVATLYHDIGKLFNPHYFTENQLGGFNIHQLLTPIESTHVIIAHVLEGETLARKYRLPQSFIDVIREHHGTTMVYYFYCKQVEQMGGDPTKVNEKSFRYPGPKPKTKESAIIMIADTIEAASRSMEEVTEESIAEMVGKLLNEKVADGQFDECELTFEELGRVKRAFVKALMVTRHLRIKYPSR